MPIFKIIIAENLLFYENYEWDGLKFSCFSIPTFLSEVYLSSLYQAALAWRVNEEQI